MVTQLKPGEWMVEPDDEGVREYARLHLKAMNSGLNVDGQAIIPWEDLLSAWPKVRKGAKNGR